MSGSRLLARSVKSCRRRLGGPGTPCPRGERKELAARPGPARPRPPMPSRQDEVSRPSPVVGSVDGASRGAGGSAAVVGGHDVGAVIDAQGPPPGGANRHRKGVGTPCVMIVGGLACPPGGRGRAAGCPHAPVRCSKWRRTIAAARAWGIRSGSAALAIARPSSTASRCPASSLASRWGKRAAMTPRR